MLRIILGIIGGVIVAFIVTFLIESIGHTAFPVAGDLPMSDPAYLDAVPLPAKLMVMPAWFLASLCGGALANAISRSGWAGWAVAACMIAGAAYSFTQIVHPTWMIAGGIILPLLAAWIASRFASPNAGANPAA